MLAAGLGAGRRRRDACREGGSTCSHRWHHWCVVAEDEAVRENTEVSSATHRSTYGGMRGGRHGGVWCAGGRRPILSGGDCIFVSDTQLLDIVCLGGVWLCAV